ncbi:MAG: hypothetical protein AABW73_01110 [Nanoarchaeota archaeon]
MNKHWDLWTYWIITGILLIYSVYIKGTCEELGCLAIIIPIIGIMIISGLELIISIIKLKKEKSTFRIITTIIVGIITVLTLLSMVITKNN